MAAYTGDPYLGEELVQEALARAWERWSTIESHPSLDAWLFRTAKNLAISRFRRFLVERRARAREAAVDRSVLPGHAEAVALRQAVATLPDRQRAAIIGRYLLGLSVAETAEALNVSEGTVKSNTSDALRHLRSMDLIDINVPEGSSV
jgi:RNA polymerase sigma-70 factor (ECF subfamily)